jgi:hypothetical protein
MHGAAQRATHRVAHHGADDVHDQAQAEELPVPVPAHQSVLEHPAEDRRSRERAQHQPEDRAGFTLRERMAHHQHFLFFPVVAKELAVCRRLHVGMEQPVESGDVFLAQPLSAVCVCGNG